MSLSSDFGRGKTALWWKIAALDFSRGLEGSQPSAESLGCRVSPVLVELLDGTFVDGVAGKPRFLLPEPIWCLEERWYLAERWTLTLQRRGDEQEGAHVGKVSPSIDVCCMKFEVKFAQLVAKKMLEFSKVWFLYLSSAFHAGHRILQNCLSTHVRLPSGSTAHRLMASLKASRKPGAGFL